MHILDEKVGLKANLKFSFQQHRWLWFLLLLTVVLDYFSTLNFMFSDGVHTEANNVVRWLVEQFGVYTGVLLGKSLQVVAAIGFVCLSKKLARAVLLLLVLLNAVAVIHNLL